VSSFKITRRNLPHWQEPGRTYFLSWHCVKDDVLSPEERNIVLEALLYWDKRKWTIYASVVMPDHVHVLAQPLAPEVHRPEACATDLGEILHSVKSFSAHKINQLRKSTGQRLVPRGSIWQDERYDRIVRDEAEFKEKWEYIRNNSMKKGLCEKPEDYPWLYEKRD